MYRDVTCVKVYSGEGNVVAIIIENGPLITVTCADDPDFKSYCEQFGINPTPLAEIDSNPGD